MMGRRGSADSVGPLGAAGAAALAAAGAGMLNAVGVELEGLEAVGLRGPGLGDWAVAAAGAACVATGAARPNAAE